MLWATFIGMSRSEFDEVLQSFLQSDSPRFKRDINRSLPMGHLCERLSYKSGATAVGQR